MLDSVLLCIAACDPVGFEYNIFCYITGYTSFFGMNAVILSHFTSTRTKFIAKC